MPTSRSRPRGAERARPPAQPPVRSSLFRLLIPVVVVAVLAVTVSVLPASLIRHALPPVVALDDLSGSVWHGSAGTLTLRGRNVGALEWRLHPAALLRLTLSLDLRWVEVGFVVDGRVDVNRQSLTARDVQGGGPLEDLAALGLQPGWRGAVQFKFDEIRADVMDTPGGEGARLVSARGSLEVADLSTPTIANGADLGGYVLRVGDGVELRDTGGPVELHAVVHFLPAQHTGTLTGTVKARPDAAPALRNQIDSLGQLHAPDATGALPLELEFNF